MKNVHKLTEGAVFLAIFAVLLMITIYVPVIGAVVNFVLPVPFMMIAAKHARKDALLFFVAAVLISFITGTIFAVPVTLLFGLTGLVIGDFLREKKGRLETYIAGSLAFLLATLGIYAISVLFMDINFVEESILLMKESIAMAQDMMAAMGQGGDELFEQLDAGVEMIQTLIPTLLIMSSFLTVFFLQLIAFPIIKRFGVEVSKSKPFRELSFPKSILWYYLLAIIASLLLQPEEGSYWFLALVNLTYILQIFMVIQGFSLIFYFSYKKGLPKAFPIIALVLSLLLPILLYIVRLLGIIDLGFGLRQRVESRDV
ncbi:YybS family protein [Bacillus mesophilum]|uniref:YybS family protein n=1 Tax=Bacillus mesophilum TaxID=1071718 RepID=A0A7V7RIN3_9BACI|nr:YybS family protein [Bacillus mesophilum]KAB2330280.1 YybS family protein [Bacillus mesophilum]